MTAALPSGVVTFMFTDRGVDIVRLNRGAQGGVMCGQRHPHAIGVGFPPTSR